jgi:SpoVK/Ycf46/Vps4 family AAA+-type ATPase
MVVFEVTDDFKAYKIKDLKIYASKEYLAEDKKKYRQVFCNQEVQFIYVELSFINKLFDIQEWEFKGYLKAYDIDNNVYCCDILVQRIIKKHEHIVYIREGWGVDAPGAYWKPGRYRWEVWIEERQVLFKPFFIIETLPYLNDSNPYFDILSLNLYPADINDQPLLEDIDYCSVFDAEKTTFIWAELQLNIKYHPDSFSPWPLEIFFNFYTETGELKGSIQELIMVESGMQTIRNSSGLGAEDWSFWQKGNYKMEFVFMNKLLAVVPFVVGDSFQPSKGNVQYFSPHFNPLNLQNESTTAELAKRAFLQLDKMVGLKPIKQSLFEYITYLKFLQIRREKGLEKENRLNLHTVFYGNPGTGKTTVAKLLGLIYKSMGLLSKGHVYEVDRADLIGEYIGQTAPKVKEAIKKAEGGILFIDEAYSLARMNDDSKDFGREAIEILIRKMTDPNEHFALIVAGYPDEMQYFLDFNPGFKSRFAYSFHFPDYTPQELLEIAYYAAEENGVIIDENARENLLLYLTEAYRNRNRNFGNARFVNTLIEKAKKNLALRVMQSTTSPETLSEKELSVLLEEDFTKIYAQNQTPPISLPLDEKALNHLLEQIHNLVGLATVKREVVELVDLVKYNRTRQPDEPLQLTLHLVFTGNPGTGKTTMARYIAQCFKALGILERGHLVETDRHNFVAGYLGQTAEKTYKLIESARGGVLFIDEAYALVQDGNDIYGKEALATLLKRMEDLRHELIVIMAGYSGNMERFINLNPGLKSRFNRFITFEDYTPSELLEIAYSYLKQKKFTLAQGAQDSLLSYLEKQVKNQEKNFGNARLVRNLIEETIKQNQLRIMRLLASPDQLSLIENQITVEDLTNAIQRINLTSEVRKIGFLQS